jgi:predicted aminopeptidase
MGIMLLLLMVSACETIGYYSQSIVGHSRMMLARESLDSAIAKSEGKRKQALQLVQPLRTFAIEKLALPDNGSYLSFVDMSRDYPVWSVVAAKEFSVKPMVWCYPIVGCASYRGYFSEKAAQNYAQDLQEKDFETSLGGVSAYSTLGWFADPVIPSMFRFGETSFIQLLFHELAHQKVYIKGHSSFNEAFATVVGEQGTLRWLAQHKPKSISLYKERMDVRSDFSVLLKKNKQRLNDLYAMSIPPEEMRRLKTAIFEEMKQDHQSLVVNKWSGKKWYSGWFKKPVNNARLASFSTYRDLVPAFEALLKECDDDFSAFYKAVATQKGKAVLATVPKKCDL